MIWWKRSIPNQCGCVLIRGADGARAGSFDGLLGRGFELELLPELRECHWRLHAEHPRFGSATFLCPREPMLPPKAVIESDARLSRTERAEALAARAVIVVETTASGTDVLEEKKRHLRFLHAALANHASIAHDASTFGFWSRSALEDELAHDAKVDVEALYGLHAVHQTIAGVEREDRRFWLHTHGLADLGFVDVDVLDATALATDSGELVRALASAVVEGDLVVDGDPHTLFTPGGEVRLVAARRVAEAGAGPRWWSEDLDDIHAEGHAVACEPAPTGLARFLRRGPRLSSALAAGLPERGLLHFSHTMTRLMGERARATYPVLRRLMEEFAAWELQPLLKCGYEVDGGEAGECEHLWFEGVAFGGDDFEAELLNEPFRIASMHAGQRSRHGVERITDWSLRTPVGEVTPRSQSAARRLREGGDELREQLRRARDDGG